MKKILTLLLVLFSATGFSQVVISHIYTASATATSVYKYNFIELHNKGAAEVDISDYSVQYGSATGNIGGNLPNGSANQIQLFDALTKIPAGGYLLIQVGAVSSGVNATKTFTPDVNNRPTMALSSSAGKLALVAQTTTLGCGATATACDVNQTAKILDLFSWGGTVSMAEGTRFSYQSGDRGSSMRRLNGGCMDENENSTDFELTTDGPLNSSSTKVVCNGNVPLPLNLTSFSVQKAGSNVQINWSTAQEQNSKNFEVQRSTDQNNWSTVATVAATGSSNTTANYSATDYSPAQGVNYYRLKIVDADNSYTMSEVKSVNFASGFAVSISPNPASTYINVTLSGNGSSKVIMSDLNGKVVYNQTTTAPKLQINSSTFAKGMYIIKVVNGADISTNKVIVQ